MSASFYLFSDRAAERNPLCRPVNCFVLCICIYPPPRSWHVYTAAGTASWDSHPSEDLSELPVDRSIIMYGGSRGGSLPGLLGKVGPARYLLWPSLMAAMPPQVVLARSFPFARPVRNVCIRGYLLFEVRDASLSYTLFRAKSRRILSMISRSSPIRVLASRSSRAFWAGDKYLFRRRESSTTYTPPLYLPGTVVSG